jgi:hypothetical protein
MEQEKRKKKHIKDTQSVQLHTGCILKCDFLHYPINSWLDLVMVDLC